MYTWRDKIFTMQDDSVHRKEDRISDVEKTHQFYGLSALM